MGIKDHMFFTFKLIAFSLTENLLNGLQNSSHANFSKNKDLEKIKTSFFSQIFLPVSSFVFEKVLEKDLYL